MLLALSPLVAHAAPTGQIKIVYAGHTTANTDSALTTNQADLTNPSFQVPAERHYFDVFLNFAGAAAGEDFRGAIFDVTRSGGVTFTTKAGVSGGTSIKWFSNNPISDAAGGGNTFSNNGDLGGDLLGIVIQQSDSNVALATQVGESGAEPAPGIGYNASLPGSRLGRVAIQFAAPLTTNATLNVIPQAGGGNFSWFAGNAGGAGTVQTPSVDPTGLSSGSFVIAVPEPGSLALLGLAVPLILRRRNRGC